MSALKMKIKELKRIEYALGFTRLNAQQIESAVTYSAPFKQRERAERAE